MKTEDMVLIGVVGVGAIIILSELNKTSNPNNTQKDTIAQNLGQATGDATLDFSWGVVSSPFKRGERAGWDLSNLTKSWFGLPKLPYPEDML